MTDYLTRSFRAQVTTAMDSLLRTAVVEITNFFEDALHGYQVELTHKKEEITRLQIKLQQSESKLKKCEYGDDRSAEKKESQSEEAPTASQQISSGAEINNEEPEDWCAPLGCESLTTQDNVCPSVRLRPLSISLWQIPIKQEMRDDYLKSQQLARDGRTSKKNKRHKYIQDRGLARCASKNQSTNTKHLLRAVKEESFESPVTTGRKLRGRNVPATEQRNRKKSRASRSSLSESELKEETVKTNSKNTCRLCNRVFGTEFGLHVHMRKHQSCRSCRKVFPSPSDLRFHQKSCRKFKNVVNKRIHHLQQTGESNEERKMTPSCKKQIADKRSMRSSHKHGPSSVLIDESTKKYSCVYCHEKFKSRIRLKDHHLRTHTLERPFVCTMCPRKFHIKPALLQHKTKMHKEENCVEFNGDFSWTRPLERSEDKQVDSGFPIKDPSQTVNHGDDQLSIGHDIKQSKQQQKMGVTCSESFVCSVCNEVFMKKYMLKVHFRIHTGEKPYQCKRCCERFHFRADLMEHTTAGCPDSKLIRCQQCTKKFHSKMKYKRHMIEFHKIWPLVCKFCGKGFCNKGSLRNHCERFHVNASVEVTV